MTEGPHRQPWLHEMSICVNGNVTAVSSPDGDFTPSTAHGLYVDDTRVLSGLQLTVEGEQPSPVGARARGPRAEFLGSARNLGASGNDPTVEIRRARELAAGRMTETITLASRAADPVPARVSLELCADGADMASVKAGHLSRQLVGASQHGAQVLFALAAHRVEITFEPSPAEVVVIDGRALAHFDISVPAGASRVVSAVATVHRTAASLFDADSGADAVNWSDIRVDAEDPRLSPLVEHALEDFQHLLLRDPEAHDDLFAAAGTPWYLTLFGRDSLWAARLMLPFGTDLAGGTLRTLARRQGATVSQARAEQPGKILHEVRRHASVDPESGLSLPPLYYGSVDATALWVVLLVEAWRWGLAEAEVRELLPALRAALAWITGAGQPDGDSILKYHDVTGTGLANQGWKDSHDAMRWRDGRVAAAPIALVEAQAYAVQALDGAAALLDRLGENGAGQWRKAAEGFRDQISQRFWVRSGGGSYLALALDGAGHAIDGLASNMGHVLGTGVLSRAEAARVAATLTGDELLDPFGIRTLGSGNGGFNPLGYHTGSIWTHDTAIAALGLSREGLGAPAGRVARALVAAGAAFDYRWPELYTGQPMLGRPLPYPASCRPQAWSAASAGALVSVALGLRANAPDGTLEVVPARPLPFGAMRVEGLRFGGRPFSVDLSRDGQARVEGLDAEVEVRKGWERARAPELATRHDSADRHSSLVQGTDGSERTSDGGD